MNKKSILTAFTELLEKNKTVRIAVLGAIAALALVMFLTSGLFDSCERKTAAQVQTAEKTPSSQSEALEARLERILARIEGVGKVQVMLTLDPAETKSSFGTGEADDADGIRAVRGVIVAAEGAANVSVRMNIISAVSTALGIDRHLVEVFVMAW